jgi:alkylhydroperoxidase/carboxymuconolactone decarboxylase family protein YurZ
MSVYVDTARNPFGRMVMCHMIADTLPELHAMAQAIGMDRAWFQPLSFPHYDVSLSRRALAVERGAVEVDKYRLVEIMKAKRASGWTDAELSEIRAAIPAYDAAQAKRRKNAAVLRARATQGENDAHR